MWIVKTAVAVVILYVGVVIVFESGLGIFQPTWNQTLTITTTDAEGERHERVLSALFYDKQLYVGVNHWPRGWYHQVLDHPEVLIEYDGRRRNFNAVPVSGEEYRRVNARFPIRLRWRILTGFPPRHIVRLDPIR